MKKPISFVTVIAILISIAIPVSIFASGQGSTSMIVSIEYLENGSYFETAVETDTTSRPSLFSTRATLSGSKTTAYKNPSGATMWTVSVQGTFSYNGFSATCTSSSGSAVPKFSNWKVSHIKSGSRGTPYPPQPQASGA